MLIMDGIAFYENDLLVLRAVSKPMSYGCALSEAVRLGATPALARGTLERLWIVGALEVDRVKVRRSAFGEAVAVAGGLE